jgi:hypothetical protein
MKIRPVVAELPHADRQTDETHVTKLTVAFRDIANWPKTKPVHLEYG